MPSSSQILLRKKSNLTSKSLAQPTLKIQLLVSFLSWKVSSSDFCGVRPIFVPRSQVMLTLKAGLLRLPCSDVADRLPAPYFLQLEWFCFLKLGTDKCSNTVFYLLICTIFEQNATKMFQDVPGCYVWFHTSSEKSHRYSLLVSCQWRSHNSNFLDLMLHLVWPDQC